MKLKLGLVTAILALAILLAAALSPPPSTAQPQVVTPHNFQLVVSSIDKAQYVEDVKALAACGSRFTGYPGMYRAAEYIAEELRKAGVAPYAGGSYFEWFEVTVPITGESWLATEDGFNVTIYPLYPNLVNPSPYESEGWDTLVYVGRGELDDFDGLNVTGKLVLMNFASSWNYYYALLLGAKGVVFVPESPGAVDRPEADQKLTLVPVNFPKLYLPLEAGGAELLRRAREAGAEGIRVRLKSSMRWESVRVPNVVGFIKGTDPLASEKVVAIAAYYDAFSIVPALAPGATDALGVAELLQLARFLAKNPPKYSVLLVALAGHYQSLWGAREFVERHFDELGTRIIAFASIDLASDSDQVGVYALGSAYTYRYQDILARRYTWLVSRAFGPWLAEMRMVLGSDFGSGFVDGILGSHPLWLRSAVPYEPYLYGFFPPSGVFPAHSWYMRCEMSLMDSEPFTLAMYGGGFAFRTTNAFRRYQRSPADVVDNIVFDNVWPQLYFIHCTLWALLNEDVNLPFSKSRFSDDWGYVTLQVKVTTYNMFTSYWDVVNFTEHPELRDRLVAYVVSGGLRIVQKVDEDGTVIVHGLRPYMGGTVDVFALDERGRITWTTDVGVWQAPGWKSIPLTSHPQTKLIAIFECASIFVPLAFRTTDFSTLSLTAINDARAHSPMIRQNSFQMDVFAMAFVQPEIPAEVILGVGTGLPAVVLNNATPANPEGAGYALGKGEQLVLTPFDILENLYTVVRSRYLGLRGRHVIIPSIEYYANLTERLVGEVSAYRGRLLNSEALGACFLAWASLLNWYWAVMSNIGQVTTSVATFFLVSLVFSLLFERLALKGEGVRRLVNILALVVVSNILLYFFHPAYHVATNWVIILLAALVLSLNVILLYLSVSSTYTTAKLVREASVGKHFIEISRSGLLAECMTLAVENMKKRKFRTVLTLSAVAAITFAVISLASITSAPVLLPQRVNATRLPEYEGILIRAYPWAPVNALSNTMISSALRDKCYVVPRAYAYPPSLMVAMPGVATGLQYIAFTPSMKTQIYAMLALAPEEANVTGIDRLLVRGRWFREGDVYAVILPESVASSLSQELNKPVDVGSKIRFWSLELEVVGIIRDLVANWTNPDGEILTPLDPQSTPTIPYHIAPRNMMIIPFALYTKLAYPPVVANIAIKPVGKEYFAELEGILPYVLAYPVYSYFNGTMNAWVARQWISAIGFEFILVPALIAAATVLDMMLAAVYERRREIYIFTSLGMAPSHITTTFLTEALTYVVPSIFFGYVIGIMTTYLMLSMGVFPQGLYPNFTSLAIIFVILLDLVLVMLAAYYPSLLAGRLAVPSLVKRWIQAEKGPAGDVWRVSYPLVLSSDREVRGFFNHLKEYMEMLRVRESTFSAESIDISEQEADGRHVIQFVAHCRFAPYDLGIRSDVVISAVKEKDSTTYSFNLVIKRTEGYRQAWSATAKVVASELRKQIIAWRSLSPAERKKYIEEDR